MTGRVAGFATLFTKHAGHPLHGIPCFIHKEALCMKSGLRELEDVMQTVMKIVNCITLCASNNFGLY
jgi:hypothetical protein